MSRATQKGTEFETQVVGYLQQVFGTRDIVRRAKQGARDTGDIHGLHCRAGRVVAELKNHARMDLAGWLGEAERERGEDDAAVGAVIHKRRGVGVKRMGDQYVTMSLRDFVILLGGEP
ncbi:hypothetical protein [Pseudactinotalea sp.]|uniref:hypothetical protein n=1 Tax=Pseudactinotalea sp. TaxID=1926260 RepID=UPI003B3ADDCD